MQAGKDKRNRNRRGTAPVASVAPIAGRSLGGRPLCRRREMVLISGRQRLEGPQPAKNRWRTRSYSRQDLSLSAKADVVIQIQEIKPGNDVVALWRKCLHGFVKKLPALDVGRGTLSLVL